MANYADDFESAGTGAGIPTGYTGRWNYQSGEWSRLTDTDIAVRAAALGNSRQLVSMNTVDSDGNRANAEVLARVKTSSVSGTNSVGAAVRASGSAGSETGYICNITSAEFRIGKYVAGTFTELAVTNALNLSANTWYWIRLRANGTTIQARIWADGGSEPGTWNVSSTDSSISAAGWCGMFCFSSTTHTWRDLAVATNGDTATMSAGPASQTLTPSLFTNDNTYYTHSISVGAITLSPSLFTNTNTYYSATLTQTATFYRPTSDITVTGWVATPSGPIFDTMNELTANDSDYATSPDVSTPATFGTTTGAAGSFNVRIRARKTATTGQIRVRLLDGTNVDVGGTAWQSLTTTPTTYTLPATASATFQRIKLELQA